MLVSEQAGAVSEHDVRVHRARVCETMVEMNAKRSKEQGSTVYQFVWIIDLKELVSNSLAPRPALLLPATPAALARQWGFKEPSPLRAVARSGCAAVPSCACV